MAFQFTYGRDPENDPQDAVRYRIGDTIEERPLLDDREIAFELASKGGNVLLAAASAADALQARFARVPDIKVGDINKSFSKVAKAFSDLAQKLRDEARKFAKATAPDIRKSTKRALEEDLDLTIPEFAIGQMDNPRALQLNDELDRLGFRGFC